jgi:hypothetical protein
MNMRVRYHTLPEAALRKRLNKRGLDQTTIERIVERSKERRTASAAHRREKRFIYEPWQSIIEPLVCEQNTLMASMAYKRKRNQIEELEFANDYLYLLRRLLERFRKYQKIKRIPPDEALKQQKIPVENDGSHWSDWIPANIKEQYILAYEKATVSKRTRKKPIFPRYYISKSENTKRERLIYTIEKLMGDLERGNLRIMPDNPMFRKQHELLNAAHDRVSNMPIHHRAPRKWDALLTAKERRIYRTGSDAPIPRGLSRLDKNKAAYLRHVGEKAAQEAMSTPIPAGVFDDLIAGNI